MVVLCLNACSGISATKDTSQIRMPMEIYQGIFDIRCDRIKTKSLPKKLKALGFAFEWTDEDKGMLTVGPIVQKLESENIYSIIRQTYFLKIVCHDELSTNISGEIVLEGLRSDGQWIGITDSKTIEQHSLEFFQKLDL